MTIPAEVRRYLGVAQGDKLSFVIADTGAVELHVPKYPTVAFLQGKVSRDELPELMARNNRRLAKRQLTWLRRDARVRWFPAEPDPVPAILRYLEEMLD